MSLEYVNKTYKLNLSLGQRVKHTENGHTRYGTITGATHYVIVKFDDASFSVRFHPTDDNLTYLEGSGCGE